MNCASNQHSSPFSKETIQQLLNSRRFAIIGNQGAGTTTFAIQLAKIIDINYVLTHKDWMRMTAPEKEEIKLQMAMRENWIVEGDWIVDGDFLLLDMVELIINLDFPLFLSLWHGFRRSIERFVKWEPPSQPPSESCKTLMMTLISPKEVDCFLLAVKRHLVETGSEIRGGDSPGQVA
jgi:hypothetical protein